jgi:hypothetical protein
MTCVAYRDGGSVRVDSAGCQPGVRERIRTVARGGLNSFSTFPSFHATSKNSGAMDPAARVLSVAWQSGNTDPLLLVND